MKVTMKSARVNAGLKQKEVCSRMGICENTLIDWEKGRKIPRVDEFQKFCEIVNCNMDDITFDVGALT